MAVFDIFIPFIGGITFSFADAFVVLKPLLTFIIGIVVYSIFVFKFYHLLAERDLIGLDLNQYNTTKHVSLSKILKFLFYVLEYIIILPIMVIFWSVILAIFIAVLSKSYDTATIALIAVAVVASVRITSYYNEDLSTDIAKLLPFVLLGVFLTDINSFNPSQALNTLYEIPVIITNVVYYFLFVLGAELILRVGTSIKDFLKGIERDN